VKRRVAYEHEEARRGRGGRRESDSGEDRGTYGSEKKRREKQKRRKARQHKKDKA